jgi:class 3 adenylate cyclase
MTAGEPAGQWAAAGPAASAERRIVSVLFADLVGFTTLSEQLDAEDVAAIQDAYFTVARETIARHGGAIEKFIGDAVMAVFGLSRTREDDAERAVRAGLSLISAVERLSAALPIDEVILRLRVGVNTGEAVTTESGPDQGRVTGDVVNTTARLQAAAAPGTVLLGETTALAVAHVVETGTSHRLELKGKAAPVPAVEALALRPERSREQVLGRLRSPLVGRDGDLGWFRERIGEVPAGSARLLLVVAAPGVGKSRFSAAALDVARDEGLVSAAWTARLHPASGPLAAIADLARAAGLAEDDAQAEVEARIGRARALPAPRVPVVARALLDLLEPGSSPSVADRSGRIGAWLDGLDALAEGRDALWRIEDVHWADEDTLELLSEAARRPVAGGARRIVMATGRPVIAERWVGGLERAVRLDLAPLAPGPVRELVAALVGAALSGQLADALAERSDGNPLFVEETLRSWIAAGTLIQDGDGSWHLAVAPADVPLPPTVQAVYAAQIDDLPAVERLTVRHGSVAGRRVPADALPVLGVDAPGRSLASLRGRGLLSGPEHDALGNTFTYRHALLRDAAYASLARGDRARLHLRLARWLEDVAGPDAGDVSGAIGDHYATALESAPALAKTVGEGLNRDQVQALAATWLERGAERAWAMCAYGTARRLLARCLSHTREGDLATRSRRLTRLAQVTTRTGHMDEAMGHLEAATSGYEAVLAREDLPDAERASAREGLSAAAFETARVHIEQLRFVTGRNVASAALTRIGPGPDGASDDIARARLRYMVAYGDYGETNADQSPAVERTLRVAEAAGEERLALEMARLLAGMRAEVTGARADLAPIAERARRIGDHEVLIDTLLDGALEKAADAPASALPALDEAEEMAMALDMTETRAWIDFARTEVGFAMGAWEDALRCGLRALELGSAHAYRRVSVRTFHLVVPMSVARGDAEQPRRLQGFYAAHKGAFPDSPYARVMRPAMNLYIADAGLAEPAMPDPARTLASFDFRAATSPSWQVAQERILRGWLDGGQQDAFGDALARIESQDLPVSGLARASLCLVRAWWEAARGCDGAAESSARESLAAARAIPAPWWMGRALALLVAHGRPSSEEAAEAAAIARQLGVAEAALRRW